MVTVGQQLRKTRMFLGITQEEMTKGIVTTSFYSRVEHDKVDININDLISILNKNNVSLRDFFEKFDGDLDQKINFDLNINNQAEFKKETLNKEYPLLQFAQAMSDYDFLDLKLVMNKIMDLKVDSTNANVINFILINYLNRSYREEQISEVKKIIVYLKQFDKYSGLFLAKIISQYYKALINGKSARAEQIKDLLSDYGYRNYVESLEGMQGC